MAARTRCTIVSLVTFGLTIWIYYRIGDHPEYALGRQLNLPPAYLLIHRVTIGSIGVLCQLDAHVPLRAIVHRWAPWIFGDA